MKNDFYEAVKNRRSFYNISKEKVISDEKIQKIIEEAVKYTPNAFNSQSARVILLLSDQHDRLWEITREALRKIVPEKNFAKTDKKIDSFKNGYGTVLFFEDQAVIKDLQENFPLYKDNFPVWSEQSSGMHQYVIWTSLELEGFGVSLQHYNELIEETIKKEWKIESTWKLIAEMPFGKPTKDPDEKTFLPIEDRVKVYK